MSSGDLSVTRGADVTRTHYDVVVVGAGVAGSVIAKVLGDRGRSVLVLEAGSGADGTFRGYLDSLTTYYESDIKVPNSPYPAATDAPQPDVLDIEPIHPGHPATKGYFVQIGPLPYGSDYVRREGGTMLHWLGTSLRMLPEDFDSFSRYGHGLDWPLSYEDLVPYYGAAEKEIGVSADVEDQSYLGITFPPGYVYPMHRIPPSYLDQTLARDLNDMTVDFDGHSYPARVISTPQGRNGMPNPAYDGGLGYTPVGAVGNPSLGLRCAGNSACIPICPIQAKYNAGKTLAAADPRHVTKVTQAVASKVLVDSLTGRVKGIEYVSYRDAGSEAPLPRLAEADVYVLTAHAIENAKLLLASGIESTSGLVGKNLMDHPVIPTWALMPGPIGSFRGPSATSGIETLRGGTFRRARAAFRIEIGNWGWNWSSGDPWGMVGQLVDDQNLFGTALRERIRQISPRQFELHFLVEQPPVHSNRVTIDPRYRDHLGHFRPVIHYDLSDYVKAGLAVGRAVSRLIFQRLGAEDHTRYEPSSAGYFEYEDQGLEFFGAGHGGGTHVMGTTRNNSVVDSWQRSWDHPNLFLVGCGSMPTLATSNPTLTMTALAFRSADAIAADLADRDRAIQITDVRP